MESFEEKKLRQEQEKLDKFGVDTHPSVRLKVRVENIFSVQKKVSDY